MSASASSTLPVPAIIMVQNSETEGANYLGYFRTLFGDGANSENKQSKKPYLPNNLHIIHFKMFNQEHVSLLPMDLAVDGGAGKLQAVAYCKPTSDDSLPPTVMQPCSADGISADDKSIKAYTVVGAMSFGGPMGVYEDAKYPFLLKVIEFLKAVVRDNIPYVGICLGAQLLAKAVGGKCHKHTDWEFAFVPQKVDDHAAYDTPEAAAEAAKNGIYNWFGGRRDLMTYQAHQDTFTLPETEDEMHVSIGLNSSANVANKTAPQLCVRIATGDYCPTQAFQIPHRRIMGVQWHPDVDVPKADHWLSLVEKYMGATAETTLSPGLYKLGELRDELVTNKLKLMEQTQALADDIFGEWLEGVRLCESERRAHIPMAPLTLAAQ